VLCLGPARKGKCKTKVLHLRGAKILFLKMLSYCSKKKEQNGLCCIIREKLLKINTIKFKNTKFKNIKFKNTHTQEINVSQCPV
jgi:hypothetical protein